jgi:hypothetical protein
MSTSKCLIEENVSMHPRGNFGRNRLDTAAVLACMAVAACSSNQEYYVIAATGTVIGVEVSQNPATQAPQAKLGYNRGELAVVPSNRPPCVIGQNETQVTCGSLEGGAKDVPDVLMELRYGGIFDTGPSSGIYQRLAVGNVAVRQPGAALMFARNASGDVDASIVAALTIPEYDELAATAIRNATETGQLEQLKALAAKNYADLTPDERRSLGQMTKTLGSYNPGLHESIRKQLGV